MERDSSDSARVSEVDFTKIGVEHLGHGGAFESADSVHFKGGGGVKTIEVGVCVTQRYRRIS